jgi:hypothetical protein
VETLKLTHYFNHPLTAIICADQTLSMMSICNQFARQQNVKFIGSLIRGVTGMVFVDLLNHTVDDIDGESKPEVRLNLDLITSYLDSFYLSVSHLFLDTISCR